MKNDVYVKFEEMDVLTDNDDPGGLTKAFSRFVTPANYLPCSSMSI